MTFPSGFTKKIIAEKSQRSFSAIIIHSTVHPRILVNHITSGIGDKNIQTRHHCTTHLKTFLDVHGNRSRYTMESTAGLLDAIENAIKKVLVDVNPAVRELARAAFWSYHAVWPQQAFAIMNGMDGVAMKQLEKANPHDSNGIVIPAPTRSIAPRKTSSAMSQMLAEKRKAKAAELAAGRTGPESPRIVSMPAPNSPSLPQGIPRSTSSTSISATRGSLPLHRSQTSPRVSPSSARMTPKATAKSGLSSPRDLLQRSRSSSLDQAFPPSPSSSRGSPSSRDSLFRQTHTVPSGIRSPASSSPASALNTLRTPTLTRKPLPTFSGEQSVGIGTFASPDAAVLHKSRTPNQRSISECTTPGQRVGVAEDALRAQAAQAVSAAQQLLDFAEDEAMPSSLKTPMRPSNANLRRTPANGNDRFRTPVNSNGYHEHWDDSPRSEAMTPAILDRLRERKHERSWWIRRQQRELVTSRWAT